MLSGLGNEVANGCSEDFASRLTYNGVPHAIAISEVAAPKVNACKAPSVWQSYDIEFTSPKFENGKKTEPARMTVYHNGVKIHDDVPIPVDNTRAGLGGDPSTPGPILLQDHGTRCSSGTCGLSNNAERGTWN